MPSRPWESLGLRPRDPLGPGRHYFFFNNALAGILILIVLIPELTHLFSESLNTGTFPQSWGTGYITPIPKDGDLFGPGNLDACFTTSFAQQTIGKGCPTSGYCVFR